MDPKRKAEYRYLLYRACIDMRRVRWQFVWWNPLTCAASVRQLRRVGQLADALHNLAKFSVYDFANFDEDQFWSTMEWYRRSYPGEFMSDCRQVFEERMMGKERF